MSNCPIASQIASHCNDEEALCPKCYSTMTFGGTQETSTILYCDNEWCEFEEETDNSEY